MTAEVKVVEVECERCNDIVDESETRCEEVDGFGVITICDDCLDNLACIDGVYFDYDDVFTCIGCDDTTHNDDAAGCTYDGESICSHCRDYGDYVWCADTETVEHCDNATWSDETEEWYYHDENIPSSGSIRSYSANVFDTLGALCFVNGVRKNIESYTGRGWDREKALVMGVELETDCRDTYANEVAETLLDTSFQDFGICKSDSTCSGPEIVTLPADLESHKKTFEWEEWCKVLRPIAKGYFSRSAGIHVHINREGISPLTQGKILVFFNDTRNREFLSLVAQRDIGNSYCAPNPEAFDKVGRCGKIVQSDKFRPAHITSRRTIEIRIFRSSLLPERIFKNLEFCDAVVKWCRQHTARNLTAEQFVSWVSKQPDYPHLNKFIDDRREG